MTYNNRPVEKEGFIPAAIMYVPRKFSDFYEKGSSSTGAKRFLKPLILGYCGLLSIEAIFVSTPKVVNNLVGPGTVEVRRVEDMRFVPKPYISDGANLKRLSPLPNLQRFLVDSVPLLPNFLKGQVRSDYYTVWSNPFNFGFAVFVALLIQHIEGMIWRKKSVSKSKGEFERFNSINKVQARPDSVAVAKLKAAQHNQYGSGDTAVRFAIMLALYIAEFSAFRASFVPGMGLLITLVYGFLTVFGFETFNYMLSDEE